MLYNHYNTRYRPNGQRQLAKSNLKKRCFKTDLIFFQIEAPTLLSLGVHPLRTPLNIPYEVMH